MNKVTHRKVKNSMDSRNHVEIKEELKKAAALASVKYIRDGMTLGLGTGSTAYYLIQEVGAMVRAGRALQAAVTSEATEKLAVSLGIPIIRPEAGIKVDLAIDGVDEIDDSFCAVKGGGGALLREKVVARRAEQVIWIMDESKLVKRLGTFPFPAEVLPFGSAWAAEAVKELGGTSVCRQRDGRPFVTDNGNWILDISFSENIDFLTAAKAVRGIPGVLETGLFDKFCDRIIVGTKEGVRERRNPFKTSGNSEMHGAKAE